MRARQILLASLALSVVGTASAATLRKVPSPAFPTIQSAIAVSQDGDTVEVKAGTYTQSIVMNNVVGVTVRGKGKVVLDVQSLNAGIQLNDCGDVTLENLEVRGASGVGVFVAESAKVTLKKVRSIGSQTNGFEFVNGFAAWVSKCIARDSGENGFLLETSQSCVRQCNAFDSGEAGFDLDGDANVLANCTVDGTGAEGIWIHDGGLDNDMQAVAVLDNKVRHAGTIGIFASGGEGPNLIRGNKVRDVVGVGIEATVNGAVCSSNTVTNTGLDGFWIASEHALIQGNSVKHAGKTGFFAHQATDAATFIGNTVNGATTVGYELNGSPITFAKNQAKQCTDGEVLRAPGAIVLAFENGFEVD